MSQKGNILITGGYGTVGRRVAADLAPDYPGRVVVAGRRGESAVRLAAELGYATRGRQIDVGDAASVTLALDGVSLVVSCIDQPNADVLRAVITRGLAYTDIAPHLMTRRPTDAMKAEAIRMGARIVLGAGLSPGISSMLARLAADRVGRVESVLSSVLLSVGDVYGPASRASSGGHAGAPVPQVGRATVRVLRTRVVSLPGNLNVIGSLDISPERRVAWQRACYNAAQGTRTVLMRTRTLAPIVLLVAVALIVATGACLAHPDDGAPDLCPSLLAVTLGLMVACSLGRPQQVVFTRLDGYHPASFEPPAPPPKI